MLAIGATVAPITLVAVSVRVMALSSLFLSGRASSSSAVLIGTARDFERSGVNGGVSGVLLVVGAYDIDLDFAPPPSAEISLDPLRQDFGLNTLKRFGRPLLAGFGDFVLLSYAAASCRDWASI
jgi:hypothetical protein